MTDWLPPPDPPSWACEAGLPQPLEREQFVAYVRRMGLDPEPLTRDLTPRTATLANVRLRSLLVRELPAEFRAYAHARYLASH